MENLPTDQPPQGVKIKDEPPDTSQFEIKKEPEEFLKVKVKIELEDSTNITVKTKEENKHSICEVKKESGSVDVFKEVENLKEILRETLIPTNSNQFTDVKSADADAIPDLLKVKLETVSESDSDKLKGILSQPVSAEHHSSSSQREEGSPNVGADQAINKEEVKKGKDGPDTTQHSDIWNSVFELLKHSGYADKATNENIECIVGWLMNGRLPTEEELHSLINPTSDGKELSASSCHLENDSNDPLKNAAENDISECDSDSEMKKALSNKCAVSKGGGKKGTLTKHLKDSVENVTQDESPPHPSPIEAAHVPELSVDIEPLPSASTPRYSLRQKVKKNLAEDQLSPIESDGSDDSDEWTPEQTGKDRELSFAQTSRKRGVQSQTNGFVSKLKKKATIQDQTDDNNEYHQKCNKRKMEDSLDLKNKKPKKMIIHVNQKDQISVKESDENSTKDKSIVKNISKDGGNVQIEESHFVTTKSVAQPEDQNETSPTTNITTEVEATTTVQDNKIITNISRTEIKTITRTEIIKELPDFSGNKKNTRAVKALPSSTNTASTSTSSEKKTEAKKPFDDVFACTRCVLAFNTKSRLQRHMFRLHYDEYIRLRNENYWVGLPV